MSDLMERLCAEARDFNFFRAVMLVEDYLRRKTGTRNPIDSGKVRFLPDESIAFPPNDIAAIKEMDGTVCFLLSFMGLTGVTSPLPVYFSEYVLAQPEKSRPMYDFLSIFNHRIYTFFYRAWKKYHFLFNFTSDGSDPFSGKVAMMCGYTERINDARKLRLLAYCGTLSCKARSAAGLRSMLSDYFDNIPVSITEFAGCWRPLQNVKPLGEDTPLGKETVLGTAYFDRAGKFRVVVGPLSLEDYERFLPGTKNISEMKELIKSYLPDPLDFDIEVRLQSRDLISVLLGQDNTRLGETSALGRSSGKTEIQSIVIN